MAEPTVRLQYADPNDYRVVEKKLVQRTVEETLKSLQSGMNPDVASIIPLLTILEGSGHPHGIDKKQDIAARRLLEGPLDPLYTQKDKNGRISMDGLDKAQAQQLLIQDKYRTLVDNNKVFARITPEQVAAKFNVGDPDYTNKLKKTQEALAYGESNAELRTLLRPLQEAIVLKKTKQALDAELRGYVSF